MPLTAAIPTLLRALIGAGGVPEAALPGARGSTSAALAAEPVKGAPLGPSEGWAMRGRPSPWAHNSKSYGVVMRVCIPPIRGACRWSTERTALLRS
jgi:hypothetical protein